MVSAERPSSWLCRKCRRQFRQSKKRTREPVCPDCGIPLLRQPSKTTPKTAVDLISAEDALEALSSPTRPSQRSSRAPRLGTDSDNSLFIPFDSSINTDAHGLFGQSGTVGSALNAPGVSPTAGPRPQTGPLPDPVPFGEYELLAILGRGGMGIVYKARQVQLDRMVALKVMTAPEILEEDRLRFAREARSAARLQHPNIVPIFDVGHHGGHDYFTMDLIQGRDLHDMALMALVSVEESLAIVEKIARAIDYAHKKGVIHRDLKPQNIIIDSRGEPHVTDFGLAKDLHDDVHLTQTGLAMGSPPYMPPEQAKGDYAQVDAVSDVYGLGAILYECLTGRAPITGNSVYEIVARVHTDDPIPPRKLNPEVPTDAEIICLKALAKQKASRYPSAAAMARDLERCIDGDPIHASPPTLSTQVGRQITKYRAQVVTIAFSVSIVLAFFLVTFISWVPSASRGEPGAPKTKLVLVNAKGGPVDEAVARVFGRDIVGAVNALVAVFDPQSGERRSSWRELRRAEPRLGPKNLALIKKALTRAEGQSQQKYVEPRALSRALVELFESAILKNLNGLAGGLRAMLKLLTRRLAKTRVDEAKLASEGLETLLRALHARARKARGDPEGGRTELVKLIALRARGRLTLPLAVESYRAEGGAATESGRAFLSALDKTLANSDHRGLISRLRQNRDRPRRLRVDGSLLATRGEHTWRFPKVSIAGGKKPPKKPKNAIMKLAKAALPTLPIPSLDGRRTAIGWLGFVYILDDESGRIEERIRMPGRVVGLRSAPEGGLVARVVQGKSQRRIRSFTIEGGSRKVSPLGQKEELTKLELLAFQPVLIDQLAIVGDLALGWEAVDVGLSELASPSPTAPPWTDPGKLEERLHRALAVDPNQPWLQLRRAVIMRWRGREDVANEAANTALESPLLNPYELVRMGIEFDRWGLVEQSDQALQRALASLVQEYGYVPAFAGHGDLDIGRQLTHHLDQLWRDLSRPIKAQKQVDERNPRGLAPASLARAQAIERWRDAFAPALNASRYYRKAERNISAARNAKDPSSGILRELPPTLDSRLEKVPSRAFAGLDIIQISLLDIATNLMTLFTFSIFGLFAPLLALRLQRRQHIDLALLGAKTFKDRAKLWWTNPLLRLQHSLGTYLTQRDKLALIMVMLATSLTLAVHDSVMATLDRRARAPEALFAGLPGHPSSLAFLRTRTKTDQRLEVRALYAFSLAKAGGQRAAAKLYFKLAKKESFGAAFNATLLLKRPDDKTDNLAERLVDLLDSDQPEFHWAQFVLSGDHGEEEESLKLAPHRVEVHKRYAGSSPMLVEPSAETRNQAVLGRAHWTAQVLPRFLELLVGRQDPNRTEAAYDRSIRERSSQSNRLMRNRRNLFFLPILMLLTLASLFVPARPIQRAHAADEAQARRGLDLLYPGLYQLRWGYTPSGLCLLIAFVFILRTLFEGDWGQLIHGEFLAFFLDSTVIKIIPFERLIHLTGEGALAQKSITVALKARLLVLLLLIYAVHWFQLTRLQKQEAERAVLARSSRMAAERQAALANS